MYRVEIHQKAVDFLEYLPEKLQENTRRTLREPREDPRPRDSELLILPDNYRVYRIHIARVLTVFFQVYDDEHLVRILKIMTIEQAHKEYRRWG